MNAEEALAVTLEVAGKDPEFSANWRKAVTGAADRTVAEVIGQRAAGLEHGKVPVVMAGELIPAALGCTAAEVTAAFALAVTGVVEDRLSRIETGPVDW